MQKLHLCTDLYSSSPNKVLSHLATRQGKHQQQRYLLEEIQSQISSNLKQDLLIHTGILLPDWKQEQASNRLKKNSWQVGDVLLLVHFVLGKSYKPVQQWGTKSSSGVFSEGPGFVGTAKLPDRFKTNAVTQPWYLVQKGKTLKDTTTKSILIKWMDGPRQVCIININCTLAQLIKK